jgi:signal transduction histidine kinase/ligand-binding sensor domain-containing protein
MRIKNILFFAVLFFFLALYYPLRALDNGLSFNYLTIADGLSNNRVWCVYRDSKDYLWIGTNVGLDRYDSYSFTKFRNIENDPETISSNSVRCIFEDRGKNLWFGTVDGLNLYDPIKETFKVFRNDSSNANSIQGNYINSIVQDKNGTLWILSDLNCLNKWVPETNSFIRYQFEYKRVTAIEHPSIKSMALDSKGNLWIVHAGRGIYCFDQGSETFQKYEDPAFDLGELCYKNIFIDESDKIWIASDGSGFFSFDIATKKFEHFKSEGNGKGPGRNSVLDIVPEGQRYLLLAVDLGGINRFDKVTKTFEYITVDEKNERGLNNNGVWSFLRDREGIIWVCTSGGGLNYSNPKMDKFTLFKNNRANQQSLSYNIVKCLLQDSEGKIWIGTDGDGINIYDPKTGKYSFFRHDPANPNSLSGNAILSLTEDRDKNIWIGTWDAGLNCFNRKSGKFIHYMPEPNNPASISGRSVWATELDSKDNLWVSIFNVGIDLFDTRKGVVINRFRSISSGTNSSSNICRLFYEDREENMWVCTMNGLSLFESESNTFTDFKFPGKGISSIHKDSIGNMWVGTYAKGLFKCTSDGTIIKSFDENSGLPSERVMAIVPDNSGRLWISTNNGLSRFNPQTENFRNYTKEDGLQGNQFVQQSFLKTKEGEIFFGGYEGLNSFHPDSLIDNDFIPPVYITDFRIANRPVNYGSPDSQFPTHISQSKEIKLKWSQSNFSFEFTAINYTHSEKNQYAYRMEGYEKEWNFTNALRRYVTYTNLDPGEYTFIVKASNNDGVWNENGTSVNVIIMPPWWKTWTFRIISFFTVLALLLFIYNSRVKNFKKQKLLLEKLVAQKTAELQKMNQSLKEHALELKQSNSLLIERQQQIEEQSDELSFQQQSLLNMNRELTDLNATKDKFFSIIAHDIKNPFNAILGFSDLLKENYFEWNDQTKLEVINQMQNSSQNLYQLLENLLQWSRSQRGLIEFHPQKISLNELVPKIIDLMIGSASMKQIVLDYLLPEKDLIVKADVQMLDTILRNLISNAIKFTYVGGKVSVLVELNEELTTINAVNKKFLKIVVADSGVGISEECRVNLFKIESNFSTTGTKNETGTGLGLILAKEFVQKHDGEIGVESVVGKGSKFYFTIPLAE